MLPIVQKRIHAKERGALKIDFLRSGNPACYVCGMQFGSEGMVRALMTCLLFTFAANTFMHRVILRLTANRCASMHYAPLGESSQPYPGRFSPGFRICGELRT